MAGNHTQFCGCGRRITDLHYCQFNHPPAPGLTPGAGARPFRTPHLIPAPGAAPKKRAVVIGISYRGLHNLKSPVNAAQRFKALLTDRLGFPNDSIRLLTDDQYNKQSLPTKANILNAMRWLVESCKAGDSLVFYFSGIATQIRDDDDDEADGYDEALCPLDYEDSGKIRDDVINATIVRPLPRGAKLHAIIDTDFCGTVLDLSLVCRVDSDGAYEWEDQYEGNYAKNTSGGLAVSISACDDGGVREVNDLSASEKSIGALTLAVIQVLQNGCGSITYAAFLANLRSSIRNLKEGIVGRTDFPMVDNWRQFANEPQLSSSKDFDIYTNLVAI